MARFSTCDVVKENETITLYRPTKNEGEGVNINKICFGDIETFPPKTKIIYSAQYQLKSFRFF